MNADDDIKGSRLTHVCAAPGCKLAGSMAASPQSSTWHCAYHYGVAPADMDRVTSALLEHGALLQVVNDGRRMIANPKSTSQQLADAYAEFRMYLQHQGYTAVAETDRGGTFTRWLYRVEAELGRHVVSARRVLRTEP